MTPFPLAPEVHPVLRRRSTVSSTFLLCLALGAALVAARPAAAASINYGNFIVPPGVSFLNVTESSGTDPVPLYGPPTPFSVGLDFDPVGFIANAASGSLDLTDGQLNFTVMSSPAFAIDSINLFEGGDYSLLGAGTAATSVFAGATLRATVTEINGVAVAPIALTLVNGSVGFNLAANPGVLQPWSLGLLLNIAAQLGPNQGATKVEIVIDNQLAALSERESLAFIAKKDFRICVNDCGEVPEPSGLGLLPLAGALALLVARRLR
jgi:hypothetical protein